MATVKENIVNSLTWFYDNMKEGLHTEHLYMGSDSGTWSSLLSASTDGTLYLDHKLNFSGDTSCYIGANGAVAASSLSSSGTLSVTGKTTLKGDTYTYSDMYVDNEIELTNEHYLYGRAADNTLISLAGVNSSDVVSYGSSIYPTYIRGFQIYLDSTAIYADGYRVPKIQHGHINVQVTANTGTDFTVAFPSTFDGQPDVFLTAVHDSTVSNLVLKVRSTGSSGFTGYIYSSGGGNHVIRWLAIYD